MKIQSLIEYILVWRIALLVVMFLALSIFPLQFNFLGGGLSQYIKEPYIWSWVNFDGEHYLSIARSGYHPLEYFFFPMYPLVIKYAGYILGTSILQTVTAGLVISHVSFFLALLGLSKLVQLDYKSKEAHITILLLLLFPTAFFFGSFFTESFFLMTVVWSFYFARKGHWIPAGMLGALACSTRIVGLALLPAFVFEGYLQMKHSSLRTILFSILASLTALTGMLFYMYFMHIKTGNAFEFMESLNVVYGEQRSDSFVLLPQVFYRYFVKILPSLDYSFFPQVFTTYLEIGTGVLFLFGTIIAFFKLRISYAMYMATAYIIPSLSGSFSSFPRYALAIFPAFILCSLWLTRAHFLIRYSVFVFSGILLFLSTMLFVRAYWVS